LAVEHVLATFRAENEPRKKPADEEAVLSCETSLSVPSAKRYYPVSPVKTSGAHLTVALRAVHPRNSLLHTALCSKENKVCRTADCKVLYQVCVHAFESRA
jgi:hypothetical protein